MEFRVSINGTILKNNPKGLDTFKKEFILDDKLFGIYTVSSFDIIFVGDGYCILKDLFYDDSSCDIFIKVEQYCNNSWKTIFDGIANISSIKLDESTYEATIEIEDNSPLRLISRNSDVSIDLQSYKDIYGNALIPASFTNVDLKEIGGIIHTTYQAHWSEAFRVILEAITGINVNVSSTYLNATPQNEIWEIQFNGTLADITNITINFTNFQGTNCTIQTVDDTGNEAINELRIRCLNEASDAFGLANELNLLQYEMDFRAFLTGTLDVYPLPTKITFENNLPITINSVEVNGSSVITATITKTQSYIDAGNNPMISSYRGLKQGNPVLLNLSFKKLMEEINKVYNVYFVANYNNFGTIDFEILSYSDLLAKQEDIVLDNNRLLSIEFDQERIYNEVQTSDGSTLTLTQYNRDLTTNTCFDGNTLDLNNSFIMGSLPIQQYLYQSYDISKSNEIFLIDNYGETYFFTVAYETSNLFVNNMNIVNIYNSNWHKIYRHLGLIKNNIIGVASFYSSYFGGDFSVNVTNNIKGYFKKYEFKAQITNTLFDSLTSNLSIKAKFKTNDGYKFGLIKSIDYNYNTGESEFTILGE
jgi:hypothetical protein